MPKFCKHCGTPIGEDGICHNCNVKKEELYNTAKPTLDLPDSESDLIIISSDPTPFVEEKPKPKKNIKSIIIKCSVALVCMYIVAFLSIGALVYFDKLDIPSVNNMLISMGIKGDVHEKLESNDEQTDATQPQPDDTQSQNNQNAPKPPYTQEELNTQYQVTPVDAKEIIEKTSTIIQEINVSDSQSVHTESEVYDIFRERGFNTNSVTWEYSMDGTYSQAKNISSYSSTKHPVYKYHHFTPDNDIWVIIETNGSIMAIPVTYNETKNKKIIICETDSFVSYDSATNKFFVSRPKDSQTTLKTIPRIDSETLDKLTEGEIDKL